MLGAAGFVLLLLAIGLALPRESRFVVATAIDAPAATVFVLVNDPRRIRLWSGFGGDDTEPEFAGPRDGSGASMAWDSPATGTGTLTIVDSRPWDYVELKLNDGDTGEAVSWFELVPGPGTTDVRWGFTHDYGFNVIGRYFGLLATGILRRDFVTRLEQLQQLAESLPRADFSRAGIERVDVEAVPLAVLSMASRPDPESIAAMLDRAYFEITRFVDRHSLRAIGPPRLILREFVGASRNLDAAIPVSGAPSEPMSDERVRVLAGYQGTAIRAVHLGAYDGLGETHRQIAAYLAAAGLERNGAPWESYVNDPADVPEAALVTDIYYPVIID